MGSFTSTALGVFLVIVVLVSVAQTWKRVTKKEPGDTAKQRERKTQSAAAIIIGGALAIWIAVVALPAMVYSVAPGVYMFFHHLPSSVSVWFHGGT